MSLDVGQKVTYVSLGKWEHGIVKSISDAEHVFVVYHCAGNWDRYFDYTAARTRISDLIPGWEDCPEWTDEKYLERAKLEPGRLKFWLEYHPDILEASKCVCDNPPNFDHQWRMAMGSPAHFRKGRRHDD